jgi:hypothetical protein
MSRQMAWFMLTKEKLILNGGSRLCVEQIICCFAFPTSPAF